MVRQGSIKVDNAHPFTKETKGGQRGLTSGEGDYTIHDCMYDAWVDGEPLLGSPENPQDHVSSRPPTRLVRFPTAGSDGLSLGTRAPPGGTVPHSAACGKRCEVRGVHGQQRLAGLLNIACFWSLT